MSYFLSILILLLPIRLPMPACASAIAPQFYQVCQLLQLYGPGEENQRYFSNFQEAVDIARCNRIALRNAPAIEESLLLPDLVQCEHGVKFWEQRTKNLEASAKLYGTYRYVDFEDAIEFSKAERLRWRKRTVAVNPSESYLDRRLALQWLRDEEEW
jgi:hypothetical protein